MAIYNRTRSKGERFASEFGVPAVYDDPDELLRHETTGFRRYRYLSLHSEPFCEAGCRTQSAGNQPEAHGPLGGDCGREHQSLPRGGCSLLHSRKLALADLSFENLKRFLTAGLSARHFVREFPWFPL